MANITPLPDGFTHWCGGDLGIVRDDRVVAMIFFVGGGFSVHDVLKGGQPEHFNTMAAALNAMLAIAAEESK